MAELSDVEIEAAIKDMADRIDAKLALIGRVAREIMGWHLLSEDSDQWLTADSLLGAPRSWNPTDDISAAFQVIEKIRADDPATNIEMNCGSAMWECKIWKTFEPTRAVDESLPRAICLAALTAVSTIEGEK